MTGTTPRSISFDRLAEIYDATRGGLERGRNMAGDVAPWVEPGRVLEVGVGTGAVAAPLTGMLGRTVVGVDLSPKMAALARSRLGDVVAVGDVHRLPVGGGRVDTVVCVWVLQLVGDLDMVFAEYARVLRPGGRLVVVAGRAIPRPDDIIDVLTDFSVLQSRPAHDITVVRQAGVDAGLTVVAEGFTTEMTWEQSPNQEADRIEQRHYGLLLDLDDDAFERRARPTIDALRALPDPDRPRQRAARHPYLVFAR